MLPCLHWYALQVRLRNEKLTAQLLTFKGYKPFLPTYLVRRRWSDRVKILEQPLFPGYLFCRLDPSVRLPILKTPGVYSIVGAGGVPVSIPESEIGAVSRIVNSTLSAEPWPHIECGDKVTIAEGPLRGVEGILSCVKNDCRLVVSISLLQRSVAVEIDRASVLPSSVARHMPDRVLAISMPDNSAARAV